MSPARPVPPAGSAEAGSRFAVVGSPIAHSLSPLLHRTAYRELGVRGVAYERFEVPAGALGEFLDGPTGRTLSGLSVTMPGKPEAFALAARSDDTSRALGISNTLLRRTDGTWAAENHDVHGLVAALRDHGVAAPDGPVPEVAAVLGSGATALSAVAAVRDLGVQRLLLTARSPRRLEPLLALAREGGLRTTVVEWAHSHRVLDADVVVSALAREGAQAVAADWATRTALPRPAHLLDVLYDPWPAPIAALLAPRGTDVADGLEMLVHQADRQLRSMLGIAVSPREPMLRAARRELATRTPTSR